MFSIILAVSLDGSSGKLNSNIYRNTILQDYGNIQLNITSEMKAR